VIQLCYAEYKRRLESQERSQRACDDELRILSTCIKSLRKKLDKLWSFAAELSIGRVQCQSRRFSRRSFYLKQYLDLVLDFKPSKKYLGRTGKLDCALREAEQFLWTSTLDEFRLVRLYSLLPKTGDTVTAECREAQLRLQELSEYENRLDMDICNVKEQLQQLLSVEDILDEEQRQRELEQRKYESYMERLERFIREVTIRLQMLVMLLLLFCKFSGISENDQPMCITMPWNIRPALIVLWGVCWMFYNPEGYVDPTDTQDAGLDGNQDLSMIGKKLRTRQKQWFHSANE